MAQPKTYNRSLDLMLAAVLAQREGKHSQCARYIAQAAEDDSLDDATDLIDAVNQSDDVDESSAEDQLSRALASVGKRRSAKADMDLELSDDVEASLGDEGSDDDLDDVSVVESRLARGRSNRAALAKITAAARAKK